MDTRRPPAEVDVDIGLVRALLDAQHAHLVTGPLTLVDEGWDNFTYRIGSDYAARIPRRSVAVDLLVNEQTWLPTIAEWLPVAVPRPVAVGAPSELFAWPWSVVEWIPGETANLSPLDRDQAPSLANALRSLHRAAPPDAPFNPFRGVPLAARREAVEKRLGRLGIAGLGVLWRRAVEADAAKDSVWLHGDLHPRNVVVRDGVLAGIIDWGDVTAGDVATDLACAWMLFDERGRYAFLEAYAPTEVEKTRAIGWAVNFGCALVDSGEPLHSKIGESIIRQLVSGDDP